MGFQGRSATEYLEYDSFVGALVCQSFRQVVDHGLKNIRNPSTTLSVSENFALSGFMIVYSYETDAQEDNMLLDVSLFICF